MASVRSQTIERVVVEGIVFANNNDVEGVTVFNTSSNTGTVTNNNGEFTIEVALNDRIEVSALQYEPVVVTVDESVIKSKELKIYLREHINNLDAVLLTYGLSGNLHEDIEKVKPPPSITIDFGNMDAYMFDVDNAFDNKVIEDALNSTMYKGQLYNGVNLKEVFKLFFKSKRRKPIKNDMLHKQKPTKLTDVYSNTVISEICNIPLESVEPFLAYLDEKGIAQELLKNGNELQLIEFLLKQSELFLKMEKH